jgi:hypothetical protein
MNEEQAKVAADMEAASAGEGVSAAEKKDLYIRYAQEFLIKPREYSQKVNQDLIRIKVKPEATTPKPEPTEPEIVEIKEEEKEK